MAVAPSLVASFVGLKRTNSTPSPKSFARSRRSFSLIRPSVAGASAAALVSPKVEAKLAWVCFIIAAASVVMAVSRTMLPEPSPLTTTSIFSLMQPEASRASAGTSQRSFMGSLLGASHSNHWTSPRPQFPTIGSFCNGIASRAPRKKKRPGSCDPGRSDSTLRCDYFFAIAACAAARRAIGTRYGEQLT